MPEDIWHENELNFKSHAEAGLVHLLFVDSRTGKVTEHLRTTPEEAEVIARNIWASVKEARRIAA